MIYLDNAATTQIATEVLNEMVPYGTDKYGNAGSIYGLGIESADAIKIARKRVADLIGANPDNIIFTSGGSESNSMVFYGLKDYLIKSGGTNILLSETEHDSVLKSAESLKEKYGFNIHYLKTIDEGSIDFMDYLRKISLDNLGLVSVMYVNNEVGAINPVKEIGRHCRGQNTLFHTDCTQAADIMNIDVDEIGCDFLTISSHKLHGPKGVGALYVRDKSRLSPIVFGGSAQEFGLRGGTENVAGIVGFGKACELAKNSRDDINDRMMSLEHRFYDSLESNMNALGKFKIHRIYNGNNHCHKIANFAVEGVDAETLILFLSSQGVFVSAGSACSSHESTPSHVLKAMGISDDIARSSIRVSFSQYNTIHEVEKAAGIISKCVCEILNV